MNKLYTHVKDHAVIYASSIGGVAAIGWQMAMGFDAHAQDIPSSLATSVIFSAVDTGMNAFWNQFAAYAPLYVRLGFVLGLFAIFAAICYGAWRLIRHFVKL